MKKLNLFSFRLPSVMTFERPVPIHLGAQHSGRFNARRRAVWRPGTARRILGHLIGAASVLFLTSSQPLSAQTVHQFSGITALPDRTISLSLTGSVDAIFGPYSDLYIIEVSNNLLDWFPLATLQQTNRPTTVLTYQDKTAAQFRQRYYRTFTNHLVTPLPQPTGPYSVGTFSRLLTDPSRTNTTQRTNHQFIITFWYPAVAQAGLLPTAYVDPHLVRSGRYGAYANRVPSFYSHSLPNAPLATNQARYPVLLYSPSLNSHRRENLDKTQELASHGYIVVGLDHRDTFLSVFPDGKGVGGQGMDGSDLPKVRAAIKDRVSDEKLALDELVWLDGTDPVLGGHLDLERVGAFGFSLGGATAAELCRVDSRCQAGVNMDGTFFIPEVLEQGVTKPFMILRSGGPDPALFGYSDMKKVFERLEHPADWVKLTNTLHWSFAEFSLIILDPVAFKERFGDPWYAARSPSELTRGPRSNQIARAYLLSFFNKYLNEGITLISSQRTLNRRFSVT